jgi:chitinase
MYLRFLFMLALTLVAVAGAPMNAQNKSADPAYRIIGYFPSWAIYERRYFVTEIPADMLTHINYAFANISDDGEVVLGDEWADTQFPYPDDEAGSGERLGNFHQLQLLKEANPHLQTLISVGGWTWSGKFSDAALTRQSREKFARSAVAFMVRYGFDGVDIDWEYPTGGGMGGNIERPEDADNFVKLLAEVRAQIDAQGERDGRQYLLTIALGSDASAYEPLDWTQLIPLLDWVNVMTYDMSGAWSEVTGFNAPLYDSSANPVEGGSTDSTMSGLLALRIPPEKLVIGVPFYGRGWTGVPTTNNGLHQRYDGLPDGTFEAGAFDYQDLAANYLDRFERYWDDTAKVPWLFDAENGTMITYDDPESMTYKAEYVREHGLGGIMFWELSEDTASSDLLTAIYETFNAP